MDLAISLFVIILQLNKNCMKFNKSIKYFFFHLTYLKPFIRAIIVASTKKVLSLKLSADCRVFYSTN